MRSEIYPSNEPTFDPTGRAVMVSRGGGARRSAKQVEHCSADQLDLSVAEVAVIWILHCATQSQRPRRSLSNEIIAFYPVARDVIMCADALRRARPSELHLIYFKGLIVADTHPRALMIDAIRDADHELSGGAHEISQASHDDRGMAEDGDALAHIADALGRVTTSSH